MAIASPGMYRLVFTAVDHDAISVPLAIGQSTAALTMQVRLPGLTYLQQYKSVGIIGSWNGYNNRAAEPMKLLPDGSFVYTEKTTNDTVGYQLVGTTGDALGNATSRSVNGTISHHYVFDGGGGRA